MRMNQGDKKKHLNPGDLERELCQGGTNVGFFLAT